MECNGYAMTYMPEHHAAYANGYVYDHVLEAEKMLGRRLTDEEVVHHIDRNRSNNRPDNLMVFDCGKSHAFYHGGGKAVCKDGVWHCERNETPYTCPLCGRPKTFKAAMCIQCRNKDRQKRIPSKAALEKLIYSKNESFESIGKQFGVSGKCVSKWCGKYGLPDHARDLRKLKK